MAIEGFDYKEFAQNLSQQALELIPPEFTVDQKNYVANTLLNFSTITGEALYNDTQLNFNLDQAVLITQIIAEWSFHKSVDLIRSGIPRQYWDSIMQKIAYTIFEVAKNAFHNNLPQDQCLQVIEHHVKKTYIDCIVELKDKNLIDEGLMEFAANQSNIDAMVQQQAQDAQNDTEMQNENYEQSESADVSSSPSELTGTKRLGDNAKALKLATLAMLFKRVQQEKVQSILDRINSNDASTVIKFMGMPNLDEIVDPGAAMMCLQEIRTKLPVSRRDIAPAAILQRIQNVSQYLDKSALEQKLQSERNKVKRFVFTALEGEYYDMPPKIANIIATHIEDSV